MNDLMTLSAGAFKWISKGEFRRGKRKKIIICIAVAIALLIGVVVGLSVGLTADEKLEKMGCARQYEQLQLCMYENNRDWLMVSII